MRELVNEILLRLSKVLFAALVGLALAIPAAIAVMGFASPTSWPAAAALGLGAVPLAVKPLRDVRLGAVGPALVAVLVATGRLLLAYGLLLAAGIAVGALTT